MVFKEKDSFSEIKKELFVVVNTAIVNANGAGLRVADIRRQMPNILRGIAENESYIDVLSIGTDMKDSGSSAKLQNGNNRYSDLRDEVLVGINQTIKSVYEKGISANQIYHDLPNVLFEIATEKKYIGKDATEDAENFSSIKR